MLNNEEDKTAFMYACLIGSNCLLQWYAVSFLVLQQLVKSILQRKGANQLSVPACICSHSCMSQIDREISIGWS